MEKFIKKSDEEITKLSDEEKSKYLAELIEWQTKSIEDLQEAAKKDSSNNEEVQKQINALRDDNIASLKASFTIKSTSSW